MMYVYKLLFLSVLVLLPGAGPFAQPEGPGPG